MDLKLKVVGFLMLQFIAANLKGQGWVAEITVNINHGDYAQEIINSGTIKLGGQTVIIKDQMAPVLMNFTGTNGTSGLLEVEVSGTAQNPYPPNPNGVPATTPINGSYSGNVSFDCVSYPFSGTNVSGNILVRPRVVLEDPSNQSACSSQSATLSATSCSGYTWAIGTQNGGPYQVIAGQSSSSIVITRAMVSSMGFANVINFYVTVIGAASTRSVQKMITLPLPPPQIIASIVNPLCSNSKGRINLTLVPSIPQLTDFVVSLFDATAGASVSELNLASTSHSFLNLDPKTYYVQVENNTNVAQFGNCATDRIEIGSMVAPQPIGVSLAPTNVSCNGYNNGSIQVSTQHAVSPLSFSWTGGGTGNNPRGNLSPGDYSVIVTDARGCAGSAGPINISQPAALSVDATTVSLPHGYNVTCNGSTNGTINTAVSGGSGTKNYWWPSLGLATSSVSNAGAGNHTVNVTDANGCAASDVVQITSPPPVTFSIKRNNPINCPGNGAGSATGSLEPDSISNTTGSLSYAWSSGQTVPVISNLSAGLYTLTITDVNQCSATANRELESPEPFTVQISPTSNYNGSNISCYGESDGALLAQLRNASSDIVPATSYEWFRNNSPYAGGIALNSIADLNSATYRVSANFGLGCSVENTFVLAQPGPVSATISPTSNHHGFAISCPGASDGSLLATGVGGTPGDHNFEWENGSVTPGITGISAGTYYVDVTDINGCEGSGTYDLIDPLPIIPVINITSNYHGQALSCTDAHDGVLTASSTNGAAPIQFIWDHGVSGITAEDLGPGIYSLTAIDANNCQVQSQTIEIINPSPVQASISVLSDYNGQAIRCHNESNAILRAGGTGGTNVYSYAWSTAATTMEINDLPHGSYSVTVTDQNNCHDSEIIEIANPQEVTVSIQTHSDFNGFGVQCNGFQNGFIEVAPAGGTGEFTFIWPSLMETTPRVENLGVGIYNVEIADANGCSDALVYEITEPDELSNQLQTFTNITCFGGSDGIIVAQATGGVGVIEFSLDNNNWQAAPEFPSLVAEVDYQITARDANACIASFSKSLTQPTEIKIDFEVTPGLCSEPVGSVIAQVTGGVGNCTLLWRNHEGLTLGVNESIQNLYAGVYSLEATDEDKCKITNEIGVTNLDGPALDVVETQPTSCFASTDGSATVTVLNGNGPFEISWGDDLDNWTRADLAAGIHYASVQDVNSCVSIAQVEIESPARITVSVVDKKDPSCFMSCDGEIKTMAEGGNGQYQFIWSESPGASEITGLCAGWYQIRVSDHLGCVGILNAELKNPEKLGLKVLSRTLPSCYNSCDGAIEVDATGGIGQYTYAWAAGSLTDLQSNICPGNHLITVKDSNNCELIENVTLGNATPINVDLVKFQSPVCFGDCNGVVEIAANGGAGNYNYLWTNGVAQAENLTLCSGAHTVVVTDQNNCETQVTYTIPEIAELKIDLGAGVVLCEGQQHKLDVGLSWKNVEWHQESVLVSTADHLIITEPGNYSVEVRDKNDCKATDSFVLEISNDLLDALFIIADEALVGDTVAIIDISWPLPDGISWEFPDEMLILEDHDDVVFGKFEDAGEFDISLSASLGECRDEITKTITIIDTESSTIGGRLGAEEDFVKTLALHPNPNTGSFEVEVEFIEETPVAMFIWNTVNSKLVAEVRDDGKNHYKKHFDLTPISSGIYLLKVEYKTGARVLRFLVH